MKLPITLLFVLINTFSQGQEMAKHHLKVNLEIPVQIGLGYEYILNDKISFQSQFGFLTEPNSTIVLNTLESLGTDEATLNMIENTFSSGVVFELGANYRFNKYYVGVYGQLLALSGADTRDELIETVIGIDLPEVPNRPRNSATTQVTLATTLIQGGVLVGRRFYLNKNYLFTELSMSANLSSSSSIEGQSRNLANASDLVDEHLSEIYSSYAFIPSIAIGYAFQL